MMVTEAKVVRDHHRDSMEWAGGGIHVLEVALQTTKAAEKKPWIPRCLQCSANEVTKS